MISATRQCLAILLLMMCIPCHGSPAVSKEKPFELKMKYLKVTMPGEQLKAVIVATNAYSEYISKFRDVHHSKLENSDVEFGSHDGYWIIRFQLLPPPPPPVVLMRGGGVVYWISKTDFSIQHVAYEE